MPPILRPHPRLVDHDLKPKPRHMRLAPPQVLPHVLVMLDVQLKGPILREIRRQTVKQGPAPPKHHILHDPEPPRPPKRPLRHRPALDLERPRLDHHPVSDLQRLKLRHVVHPPALGIGAHGDVRDHVVAEQQLEHDVHGAVLLAVVDHGHGVAHVARRVVPEQGASDEPLVHVPPLLLHVEALRNDAQDPLESRHDVPRASGRLRCAVERRGYGCHQGAEGIGDVERGDCGRL
mmetsp:Transcript_7419/g.14426  ORF Transcript_7419/g.14426 Transcript_7419/m.14426 type:complete len:234 (-) Transcript_7419:172-873(-)